MNTKKKYRPVGKNLVVVRNFDQTAPVYYFFPDTQRPFLFKISASDCDYLKKKNKHFMKPLDPKFQNKGFEFTL